MGIEPTSEARNVQVRFSSLSRPALNFV